MGGSSEDKPEAAEHEKDDKEEEGSSKEEEENKEGGGFFDKVKGVIQEIGETIGFGKPTADVSGVHLPKVSLDGAEVIVDVLINNPNPVPIPLADINYLIESKGRKLISGLILDAGTIQPHGDQTVKIPISLIFDDIKTTYADIKSGTIIPYTLKADLAVDVPVFGKLTIPLEKTGDMPVPTKPYVDIDKIRFQEYSWDECITVMHVRLGNPNEFDLGLNSMDYEVWLCDTSVATAELQKSAKIAKNGTGVIEIPMTFRPKDFGSALWDMIRGKGTGYSIKGNVNVDTPFGEMKLPISKEGGTTRIKKNDDDDDDDN